MRSLGLFFTLLIVGCGFEDPRSSTVSEEVRQKVAKRAAETAKWVPWCDGYPSKQDCSDGDAMAHGIGYLAAMGFEPSVQAVRDSVNNGFVERSPNRNDTDNASSRDQFIGFLAAQTWKENRWLEVKRHVLEQDKLCKNPTDTRCSLTPVVYGLIGDIHSFLGYPADISLAWYKAIFPSLLMLQSATVPTGYQLNLMVNAAWIAYQSGNETSSTYLAAKNAYLRQQDNPWFCIVALGVNDFCAEKALAIWPEREPEYKNQWSLERDTNERAWLNSMGWEFLFISALYQVDLNLLDYRGRHDSKGGHQLH
jgi:hypothetical protein